LRYTTDVAEKVEFVRTWQEYDDVTDYLTRQQSKWRENANRLETPKTPIEAIGQLEGRVQQYMVALNSLDAYQTFASRFSRETSRISLEQQKLKKDILTLQAKLEALKKENQKRLAKK
jgi:DNA repair exonuclease SbcCD ATPase subunit